MTAGGSSARRAPATRRCRELSRTFKRRQPLSLGEILNGVGVEERIDRFGRPGDRRDAVAPGPTCNLAETFDNEGLAQRVAQRDLPQPDYRMRSSLGGGDRKLSALSGHGLAQSRDQVSRQKRTVSRSAEDPLRVGSVGRGPVEPGQDSGERSWMMLHPIGNDGQAERRKAQGIAVGAEKQAFALRLEPRNDAGQNRAGRQFRAAACRRRPFAAPDRPRAPRPARRKLQSSRSPFGVWRAGRKALIKEARFEMQRSPWGGSACVICPARRKSGDQTREAGLTASERSTHVEP